MLLLTFLRHTSLAAAAVRQHLPNASRRGSAAAAGSEITSDRTSDSYCLQKKTTELFYRFVSGEQLLEHPYSQSK